MSAFDQDEDTQIDVEIEEEFDPEHFKQDNAYGSQHGKATKSNRSRS
ncbi:hypothetical protein [Spirosoma endophyticum]|uniref:Uncharacterized protein n=1 Tax=Spirosoma endophyticum TaxID=662367 RepID=A0A1I2GWD1_9BACT|nr:hypothetical protein [Spirosoma endophyticum]SFF22244.1 hypothetical protein SAMN05216167_13629 [Spirosoma endophyticum]